MQIGNSKPLIIVILILLIACKQSNIHRQTAFLKKSLVIDTSRYALLKFDEKKDNYYFDKNVRPDILSYNEILEIEALIKKEAVIYNIHIKKFWDSIKKEHPYVSYENDNQIKNPSKYYKQLIAVRNLKGEKEVWVNCFYSSSDKSYWKKDIVSVEDGGSFYFNLKINLTNHTVLYFRVNGVA